MEAVNQGTNFSPKNNFFLKPGERDAHIQKKKKTNTQGSSSYEV